ncbi:MAG TPA: hypothetical protein VGD01_19320 [Candidatus Elarobacter sp.]|jgi:hypothetical protein
MSAADRINYVNIGLMVASCLVAFVIPFELFLFSYAVLGPLHYLTEISWLHDRNYFVRSATPAATTPAGAGRRARKRAAVGEKRGIEGRWFWLALVGVTLAVMLFGLLAEKVLHLKVAPTWEIGLFYLVFVSASLFGFVRSRIVAGSLVAVAVVALTLFSATPLFGLIALFLVTIVHVFVFTAAFMLFGALKSRSASGLLSLVVLALCAVSFFAVVPETFGPAAGSFTRASYGSFTALNAELIKLFHLGAGSSLRDVYESSAGLVVMRLIAFAYTYHYLNWFSKTSVIKWHEVPKRRTALILALWVSALAIYAYSYELGFVALYFLSVLHVMLEFPLNHQSFVGIGKELAALARLRRAWVTAKS